MNPYGPQGWRDLPHHLLDPVLAKLQALCGPNGAAIVRLVCKSWLAAFKQFPGAAVLMIQAEAVKPLERLFGLMPHVTDLRIHSSEPKLNLDLAPLQARTQLTSISFTEKSHMGSFTSKDLGLLPKTLKELTLEGFDINEGFLSRIEFSDLTKLDCGSNCYITDIWALLQQLPALKELRMPSYNGYRRDSEEKGRHGNLLGRMSLEILQLKGGADPCLLRSLNSLQELGLDGIAISEEWAQAFASLSHTLTQLTLNNCGPESHDTQLSAVTCLRELHLLNSNRRCIDLAGPNLLSLSSSAWYGLCGRPPQRMENLATLTRLTRLELADYRFKGYELDWLRDLAVEELILINCSTLSSRLFCSGAFTALRKLHLEEDKDAEDYEPAFLIETHRAQRCQTLAALPCLRQVSGNGRLFTEGMLSAPAGWLESDFTKQTVKCHTSRSYLRLTVFTEHGV